MAQPKKDSNNEKENQLLKVATLKRQMLQAYKDEFEKDSPQLKTNLTFTQVDSLTKARGAEANKAFKTLFIDGEWDSRTSLNNVKAEALLKLEKYFTDIKVEKNLDDDKLAFAKLYQEWYNKEYPKKARKFTPKQIRGNELYNALTRSKADNIINLRALGIPSMLYSIQSMDEKQLNKVLMEFKKAIGND
jgi:hypothetical protein